MLNGSILDVVIYIRKGSPTYGHNFNLKLSAENQFQLFIPTGFVHGYSTLRETFIFMYKVDQYYNFESEVSTTPNDTALGIDWQIPKKNGFNHRKTKSFLHYQRHPLLIIMKIFISSSHLVTGGSGQLGRCFQTVDNEFSEINLFFASITSVRQKISISSRSIYWKWNY